MEGFCSYSLFYRNIISSNYRSCEQCGYPLNSNLDNGFKAHRPVENPPLPPVKEINNFDLSTREATYKQRNLFFQQGFPQPHQGLIRPSRSGGWIRYVPNHLKRER